MFDVFSKIAMLVIGNLQNIRDVARGSARYGTIRRSSSAGFSRERSPERFGALKFTQVMHRREVDLFTVELITRYVQGKLAAK